MGGYEEGRVWTLDWYLLSVLFVTPTLSHTFYILLLLSSECVLKWGRESRERWKEDYGVSIQVSALLFFFFLPSPSYFFHSHTLFFSWTCVICKCKDATVQEGRVLSASLTATFEEAQYNILMIGDKEEESFVLYGFVR